MKKFLPIHIKVKNIIDSDGSHFTENTQFPDIIGFGTFAEDAFDSFKERLPRISRSKV